MLIDGEKFACQSCIKGHRVSNCNHADRPLTHIAPKGRPVKQCDHCRDARKAKSHHAKCDCGSKRPKERSKGEAKSEEAGCCCNKGDPCVCGNKAEAADLRLESTLNRPTLPVSSRPRLNSSISESANTTFGDGHHKPLHPQNHLAHTTAAPYKITKVRSSHGHESFSHRSRKSYSSVHGSVDLTNVKTDASTPEMVPPVPLDNNTDNTQQLSSLIIPGLSMDNINTGIYVDSANTSSNASTDDLQGTSFNNFDWLSTNISTLSEVPPDTLTSPTYQDFGGFDWSIPSAEATDYFSPADLPLVYNRSYPGYAQPISHGEESGFQSIPTLTASSSGARSEAGLPHEGDLTSAWQDGLQMHEDDNAQLASMPVSGGFGFASLGIKHSAVLDSYQAFPNHRAMLNRTHRLSDSTAVPDLPPNEDLANDMSQLGSLSGFVSPVNATFDNIGFTNASNTNTELNSITIPVGNDDDAGWYFPPATGNPAGRTQSYGWLLDSQQQ